MQKHITLMTQFNSSCGEMRQNSLEECATVDAEVTPGPVTQIPCFPHTDRPASPSCLCDQAKSGHYSLRIVLVGEVSQTVSVPSDEHII